MRAWAREGRDEGRGQGERKEGYTQQCREQGDVEGEEVPYEVTGEGSGVRQVVVAAVQDELRATWYTWLRDTAGPGRGGGGDFPKHSSVTASSFISTRLSRSNSLESGVIRGQHHQGRGKGEWSKAGVIRGSEQVDTVVTCSWGGVI